MKGRHINKYPGVAEYNADTGRKSLKGTAISVVGNDVVVDGVNVETDTPDMGDAVYHDADKKVHFIKGSTVKREALPAGYVAIGVCGPRRGSQIFVMYRDNEYHKFAEFFRWKISGWNLDGHPHACEVKLQNVSIGTFTYTASTFEQCAVQLGSFLKANCKSEKPHIAYVENGNVMMQLLKYNTWSDYNASISALTVDNWVAQELPVVSRAFRKDSYGYPVWNIPRALEYYEADSTNASYNPESVIDSVPAYPVCLPAYLGTSAHRDGDKCAWLRARYGEGRQGWESYMSSLLPFIPYPKGMMSVHNMSGKDATYLLAGQTVDNGSGVQTTLYPAAGFAANVGFEGVAHFEKGDWFFPNAEEFVFLARNLRYGLSGVSQADADPMNATLYKMGLGSVSCSTNSWLASRNGSYSSWVAYGNGNVDSGSFYYRYRVLALALFQLG